MFYKEAWIPAFAGMTRRDRNNGANFNNRLGMNINNLSARHPREGGDPGCLVHAKKELSRYKTN